MLLGSRISPSSSFRVYISLLRFSGSRISPSSFRVYISLLRFSMCFSNTTIFPLNIFIIVSLKLFSPKSNMLTLSESVFIVSFLSGSYVSLSLSHNFWVKIGHCRLSLYNSEMFCSSENCWDFCSVQVNCLQEPNCRICSSPPTPSPRPQDAVGGVSSPLCLAAHCYCCFSLAHNHHRRQGPHQPV